MNLSDLQNALPKEGLFGAGTWKWSPKPLEFSKAQIKSLQGLGHILAKFQQACDTLYRRSTTGKAPAWIAKKLDAGKPSWLIEHQRLACQAGITPRVIRPDLLLCKNGKFALTELDSVPGGIGITAWLSQQYTRHGFSVLGGEHGMIDGFRSLLPNGGDLLLSKESNDYRPEMHWLCQQLGEPWQVVDAETYQAKQRHAYRFFELFDWKEISNIQQFAAKISTQEFSLTPPLKPILEEKFWLAAFWTPSLHEEWKKLLRASHLERLQQIIPHSWIIDSTPIPPHAAIPWLNVHSWQDVANFSQKERELVLKISGFDPTAWGSRGVHIGHDLPKNQWQQHIQHALTAPEAWIVQQFAEGEKFSHPIFQENGSIADVPSRARVCPYYFTSESGETTLAGCLATLVPANKKKIHGMSDGALIPCSEKNESNS